MILSSNELTGASRPGIVTPKTKIVEVIGPPGIGKSTMCKFFFKKWNSRSNWIYPERLFSLAELQKESKFWPEYQLRKLLNKEARTIPVDFGLRYVDNHEELTKFLYNHLCNFYPKDEIGKLYRSVYFLFRDYCRYQAIWETDSKKPCIIDEGLLVKSFFVLPDEQEMKDLMNTYLPLLPLPHAIIFVNTPRIDVIVEKLLRRKKMIASHIGKDRQSLEKDIERWQSLFAIILGHMEKYNVPVYHIDGLKTIEEKVAIMNGIFK